ncbi:twin-arginine translocase TatA/TatE family subunit [Nonomuraea sp. KC401]|uniref:Sec-independent protein translocase protein TatA n=1 Tax=Nonomuraea longispora TaxID=1848320 RepID=A0A4V2XKY2_9ACTN|nr:MULTISPECIES: Sec-independent protein translocase subunit TatA [Nonomuraea]NBE95467.1 twin-arginine translocase TatA/TatE family subunit [Nonomuraea sp. K271]TDC08326.1 twin-arginine translocase TatA/TatE family subunit [Nonomuraea longispora]TLF83433.1 twin-arginine translocase TatA/TatE family subunit [Nonomuraea sp. KC401]
MNLGAPEIILILVALVLLFGAKKLPDLARGVGRSLRIFKAETSKMNDDDDKPTVVQTQPEAQQQPATPQQLQAAAPSPEPSPEEQARRLEEQAAKLRASAQADKRP